MNELRKLIDEQLHKDGLLWYNGLDLAGNFARMIEAVERRENLLSYNEGYAKGYNEGYSDGDRKGYDQGYSEGLMKD